MQTPSMQLPWWDSQLFGSAVVGLIVAVSGWITNRKQKNIQTVVDQTKIVADKTHTLVNSQMGEQLRIRLVSAQALWEVTKKPEHLKLLDDAKTALADHNRKQAEVDAGQITLG
jgi:hypothetical protein